MTEELKPSGNVLLTREEIHNRIQELVDKSQKTTKVDFRTYLCP